MIDVNAQLQLLFNNHGITTIPLEQKFLLLTNQLALVESGITQRHYPAGVSSQLDIRLTIKDRVLIESFGDIGDTSEEAIENNVKNFARNSFHVIIGALQDTTDDEQINIEQWQINGHWWQAYYSNYNIKTTNNKPVYIPSELFPRIEKIIKASLLTQEYHWFRFFFSCNNSKVSAAEFLCDNEASPEALQDLVSLDWRLTPEFYSMRLFFLLRRLK